jgi:nucleotide-binding universal stress UspA family protein
MRVLVAIDGSAAADRAVELAANVDWPAGSRITVLTATETGADVYAVPTPALTTTQVGELEERVRQEAERIVAEARTRLERNDLDVAGEALVGRPASTIIDRAGGLEVDLVVVGSRGHGTIASMVLGSTSAEVIDHAPAPVLVARGARISRVVLAWDGSSSAGIGGELLRTWPIFADSEIRVVSVADRAAPWWAGVPDPAAPALIPVFEDADQASRAQHDELAKRMAGELGDAGRRAEPERRSGDPAAQVLEAAAAFEADLIVIGTHGRTGLKRLVLGSVARNVVQHATCSVLVVREPSPDG